MSYEAYLEKYCKTYKVSKAVAETHATVQNVKKYYEEGVSENESELIQGLHTNKKQSTTKEV